jgi:hypothetical protein
MSKQIIHGFTIESFPAMLTRHKPLNVLHAG